MEQTIPTNKVVRFALSGCMLLLSSISILLLPLDPTSVLRLNPSSTWAASSQDARALHGVVGVGCNGSLRGPFPPVGGHGSIQYNRESELRQCFFSWCLPTKIGNNVPVWSTFTAIAFTIRYVCYTHTIVLAIRLSSNFCPP